MIKILKNSCIIFFVSFCFLLTTHSYAKANPSVKSTPPPLLPPVSQDIGAMMASTIGGAAGGIPGTVVSYIVYTTLGESLNLFKMNYLKNYQ